MFSKLFEPRPQARVHRGDIRRRSAVLDDHRGGRCAHRRGPRHGAVGLVGDVDRRLQLGLVHLRPPAVVRTGRRGRLSRRGSTSITTGGLGGRTRCSRSRSRASSWCSCPASAASPAARVVGSARTPRSASSRVSSPSSWCSYMPRTCSLAAYRGAPTGSRASFHRHRHGRDVRAGGEGTRPRHVDGDRVHRDRRDDRGRPAVAPPRERSCARAVRRRRAGDRRALPAEPRAHLLASGPRPAEPFVPDHAVADRAGQWGPHRGGPRQWARQVVVPARGAHRLHLRDHRRGDRCDRLPLSLLALFAAFAVAGAKVALRSKDRFGMLLAAGVTIWIDAQALLNVAMVVGLAPVQGTPLPFISAGGSSLVILMAAAGILANVARHCEVTVPPRGSPPAPTPVHTPQRVRVPSASSV